MKTIDILVEIVKELTEVEDINISIPLKHQLDSLDVVRVVMDVEERFWIDINDEVVYEYNTLESLAQFIDAELMNQST